MSGTILQPVVGYGFSEAVGDHRLNAEEEQLARRISRSPFWRDSIARIATTPPPPPFVITAPPCAAGEEFDNSSDLFHRIYQLRDEGHNPTFKVKGQP